MLALYDTLPAQVFEKVVKPHISTTVSASGGVPHVNVQEVEEWFEFVSCKPHAEEIHGMTHIFRLAFKLHLDAVSQHTMRPHWLA